MAQPTTPAAELQSGEPEAPTLDFPLSWLMDHASPAIAYRAYTEVAGLPAPAGFSAFPLSTPASLRLASLQALDGCWYDSMLRLPESEQSFEGVGTIPAFQRLVEYGWPADAPPLMHARRVLFRLLAEDNDPRMLYELAPGVKGKGNELGRRARTMLREAAAAALAQGGYESDPRLRGAARRILERIDGFLDSELVDKPWTRIGNRHVLAAEVAPPSMYALMMMSHMPLFRSEQYPEIERLYAWVSQPKPTQESVQMVGTEIVSQPHLVLGDLLHNKNVVDSDVPFALLWLETMARLHFLKRNDNWVKMFERLVDDRDRAGVWHPRKGDAAPETTSLYAWPAFPLDDPCTDTKRWTDVTFRIGLIAKLLGWKIRVT